MFCVAAGLVVSESIRDITFVVDQGSLLAPLQNCGSDQISNHPTNCVCDYAHDRFRATSDLSSCPSLPNSSITAARPLMVSALIGGRAFDFLFQARASACWWSAPPKYRRSPPQYVFFVPWAPRPARGRWIATADGLQSGRRRPSGMERQREGRVKICQHLVLIVFHHQGRIRIRSRRCIIRRQRRTQILADLEYRPLTRPRRVSFMVTGRENST